MVLKTLSQGLRNLPTWETARKETMDVEWAWLDLLKGCLNWIVLAGSVVFVLAICVIASLPGRR